MGLLAIRNIFGSATRDYIYLEHITNGYNEALNKEITRPHDKEGLDKVQGCSGTFNDGFNDDITIFLREEITCMTSVAITSGYNELLSEDTTRPGYYQVVTRIGYNKGITALTTYPSNL